MNSAKDRVFRAARSDVKAFQFNREVAEVFDDMVSRSVPIYHEVHGILMDLLERRYQDQTAIYDLGCSTGTTLLAVDKFLHKKKRSRGPLIGIDNSAPMLKLCRKKWREHGLKKAHARCESLESFEFDQPAGLVIMNYTLQFIPPKERARLLKKITKALVPGGVFMLAEKIQSTDPMVEELITQLYYDFKRRRGYSELEIAQKREALERVLIPLPPEKQIAALHRAGLKHVDMVFRWYNFAVYLGIK